MTVKCQVLSDGFDGGYFMSAVNVHYFSEGGESPGQWFGTGAAALQLRGTVEGTDLQRLLAGIHPRHATSLVQMPERKSSRTATADDADSTNGAKVPVAHRPGFDLQFSVPKSLSALWAVVAPELRSRITAAFDHSVKATLSYAEQNLDLTRRGKNGHRREQAKLVVAMFDHVTSRNGDPLLHRHCLINNVCQRQDGSWGTIDSRTLHNWARTLGPLFRATLATELRGIGLELVDATTPDGIRKGHFEVAGIPDSLVKTWSSRRQDLVERLEGKGETLGDATAKARERAAIQSRPQKEEIRPRDQLHADWRKVASKHGFTTKQADALIGRATPPSPDRADYDRAWTQALTNLTKSEAHFTERRLIQEVAEQLQTGQMTGTEIAQRVRADLDRRNDIVPLREAGSDRCFTTKEMWEREQTLLKDVASLKEQPGAQVSERIVSRILRESPQLDAGQMKAIETLLTGESSVRAMTGVAGAGKSTTLKAVKNGLEAAGYQPVGVALSGVAKEELAEATGMSCRTINSFLNQTEKSTTERIQDRLRHDAKQLVRAVQGKSTYTKGSADLHAKSVLVVDEAGMIDTQTMQRLVKQVRDAGATMLLVGDVQQLQPIDAGGPFRRIIKDVPTAHLSVNHRQHDGHDRDAVAAVRDGEIAKAFRNYAERGRIRVGENRRETIGKLVETWTGNGGVKRPADHLILTQTRAEAAEANRQCQAARLDAAKTPHLFSVRHGDDKFYRGDRILFHAPDRRIGIENGYRGTVVSVDPIRRELKVRLDRESQTVYGPKPEGGVITVPLKEFQPSDLTLGYAATTHKSQGTTVDHAYVFLGGRMTDNELAYVQLTRARKSTHLFVDKSHAGDNLQDLIAAVEKSRAKVLAHEKARRQSNLHPELEQDR